MELQTPFLTLKHEKKVKVLHNLLSVIQKADPKAKLPSADRVEEHPDHIAAVLLSREKLQSFQFINSKHADKFVALVEKHFGKGVSVKIGRDASVKLVGKFVFPKADIKALVQAQTEQNRKQQLLALGDKVKALVKDLDKNLKIKVTLDKTTGAITVA